MIVGSFGIKGGEKRHGASSQIYWKEYTADGEDPGPVVQDGTSQEVVANGGTEFMYVIYAGDCGQTSRIYLHCTCWYPRE
jgi:hypothetical protein